MLIKLWNREWQRLENHDNKLFKIKEKVAFWHTSERESRRKEVALARLRIGYTRLTHGFLMSMEPMPTFAQCKQALSVQYILVDCPQTALEVSADTLADLLGPSLGRVNTTLAHISLENITKLL